MAKSKPESSSVQTIPHQPDTGEVVERLREIADPAQPYYGCKIRDLTPNTPASEWPTSLDRRVPEQRAAIFNAGNPANVTVQLGGTVKFTAVHWLMYVDERQDEETGEVKPLGVLVLFDKDGNTFKTYSQFAPRRLKAALELYGPSEWINGITFIVQDRASKMPGRHYHDIRIVVTP